MWGRQPKEAGKAPCMRNTPTHVGKTIASCHPSMVTAETPPRMWGRLCESIPAENRCGNTPTHVGKTQDVKIKAIRNRKHPHACGEDLHHAGNRPLFSETPPRMWGRHLLSQAFRYTLRNTPTHVGKTENFKRALDDLKKHPHACGEDGVPMDGKMRGIETPPRMWGRQKQRTGPKGEVRNTPTHVGKTSCGHMIKGSRQKHPHACGEDTLATVKESSHVETPPRMWGRPRTHTRPMSVQWKHPHACGEDRLVSRSGQLRKETPPRMWGRLISGARPLINLGNTPTHVGKTTC